MRWYPHIGCARARWLISRRVSARVIGRRGRCRPEIRDESSISTQDRVGLDHEDGPAVTAERTRERGEDRAVVGFETRTDMKTLQHRGLVAEHEDLDIVRAIGPTAQHMEVEYKTVEQATRRSSQRPDRADHAGAKPQFTAPDEFFGTHTS